jgi:NAD(P)H-nitrite reductase large subunit
VFDERTAVDSAGQSITPAEAEILAQQLGPRAGKALRKRLEAAGVQTETNTPDAEEGRWGR